MWKLYGKSAREGYDSLLVAIRKRCKDIQEQQDEMHAEEAVLEVDSSTKKTWTAETNVPCPCVLPHALASSNTNEKNTTQVVFSLMSMQTCLCYE